MKIRMMLLVAAAVVMLAGALGARADSLCTRVTLPEGLVTTACVPLP